MTKKTFRRYEFANGRLKRTTVTAVVVDDKSDGLHTGYVKFYNRQKLVGSNKFSSKARQIKYLKAWGYK